MLALPRPGIVSIKPVGAFDIGRMARLHRACFEDAWSRADLVQLLSLPGGFGLIARVFDRGLAGLDAMRGVGFCLGRVVRDESELLSIGVLPHYRGRRIGVALLEAAMARAREAGARTMFLEVAIDNRSAQALYARQGFQSVGTRLDYYQRGDGHRVSAYTMRAELGEA